MVTGFLMFTGSLGLTTIHLATVRSYNGTSSKAFASKPTTFLLYQAAILFRTRQKPTPAAGPSSNQARRPARRRPRPRPRPDLAGSEMGKRVICKAAEDYLPACEKDKEKCFPIHYSAAAAASSSGPPAAPFAPPLPRSARSGSGRAERLASREQQRSRASGCG